jgi:hypothetical protein
MLMHAILLITPYAVAGLFAWLVIGCVVWAALDHKDQRLLRWASSCPVPLGYELTLMLWPLLVAYVLCRRR